MNSPLEVLRANIRLQEGRAAMPLAKMIILGIMAGMFIALGAATSNVGMHAITNVGLARVVAGCIFPIGLTLIVFIGGELFTGDCLMVLGVMHRTVKVVSLLRTLVVVWVTNLIGAVLVAVLVYFSGELNFSGGLLGAFTIKVALGKSTMSFGAAFCSGILCNIFVCGAVLMAAAAKDAVGKVWSIFFPIFAFIIGGFEHCVANMYYIPAGILAAGNEQYVQVALQEYGIDAAQLANLSWKAFFVNSSIPVTLGNMVGGMVFLGLLLFLVHKKDI